MESHKPCGLHCLKVNELSVKIGKDQILENVNIHIHCGQLTVVIGRNGAGKSTLLKAILGEVKHTGTITFFDKSENTAKKLKIGYVPQTINMEKGIPTTVYDMFASLICNKPVWIKQNKAIREKIINQLKIYDAEKLIDKSIGDLSGGEIQRVLLAIATIDEPNLLILDEPISGIDENGIRKFYEIVDKLKKEHDMSIILVSHDLEVVKKYADKVILLDKKILKEGTAEEVFESKEYKEIFGE